MGGWIGLGCSRNGSNYKRIYYKRIYYKGTYYKRIYYKRTYYKRNQPPPLLPASNTRFTGRKRGGMSHAVFTCFYWICVSPPLSHELSRCHQWRQEAEDLRRHVRSARCYSTQRPIDC